MTDTIKLLETIGKDASLRLASREDLAKNLEELGASEMLKNAAASGDSSYLTKELGYRKLACPNHVNQYAPPRV